MAGVEDCPFPTILLDRLRFVEERLSDAVMLMVVILVTVVRLETVVHWPDSPQRIWPGE